MHGLPKSMEMAMKWLIDAAEKGDASAQYDLGITYIKGRDVAYNESEAVKWFLRAANQGQPGAENGYGYALAHGIGGQTNLLEGYKWLALAFAQKDPQAQVNLPALAARLSPEEIEEGKRRAAAFKPKPEMPPSIPAPKLEDLLKSNIIK
jgi:TPR repeat protein